MPNCASGCPPLGAERGEKSRKETVEYILGACYNRITLFKDVGDLAESNVTCPIFNKCSL
jgi:hypothetical protein